MAELCAEERAEAAPAQGAMSRQISGSPTPDPDPDKFFVELKLKLNQKFHKLKTCENLATFDSVVLHFSDKSSSIVHITWSHLWTNP